MKKKSFSKEKYRMNKSITWNQTLVENNLQKIHFLKMITWVTQQVH